MGDDDICASGFCRNGHRDQPEEPGGAEVCCPGGNDAFGNACKNLPPGSKCSRGHAGVQEHEICAGDYYCNDFYTGYCVPKMEKGGKCGETGIDNEACVSNKCGYWDLDHGPAERCCDDQFANECRGIPPWEMAKHAHQCETKYFLDGTNICGPKKWPGMECTDGWGVSDECESGKCARWELHVNRCCLSWTEEFGWRMPGRCLLLPLGSGCENSDQCDAFGGWCENGKCVEKHEVGENCDRGGGEPYGHEICKSGWCGNMHYGSTSEDYGWSRCCNATYGYDDSTSVFGPRPLCLGLENGATCQKFNQCLSGFCQGQSSNQNVQGVCADDPATSNLQSVAGSFALAPPNSSSSN